MPVLQRAKLIVAIAVSMSNRHSSSTLIDLTVILTEEYREEVDLTLDPPSVPRLSEVMTCRTISLKITS